MICIFEIASSAREECFEWGQNGVSKTEVFETRAILDSRVNPNAEGPMGRERGGLASVDGTALTVESAGCVDLLETGVDVPKELRKPEQRYYVALKDNEVFWATILLAERSVLNSYPSTTAVYSDMVGFLERIPAVL